MVVSDHAGLAQPGLERVALAYHSGGLGMREQLALVAFGRLADGAAIEQRLNARDVAVEVAAEPVRLRLGARAEHLAKPADLDADGAGPAGIAIEIGGERLAAHPCRAGGE